MEWMPAPGELVAFLRRVEAIPAPSATSQNVSTVSDSIEVPTVVERN
jgi:hypothetical protein